MPDNTRYDSNMQCDVEGSRVMLERLLKVARILVHYSDDLTGSPRNVCDEKSRRSEFDL
jgi:hypothetical protein